MPPHTATMRRQLFKMTFIYLFKCKCLVGTFFRLFASAVKIRGRKHQEHGSERGCKAAQSLLPSAICHQHSSRGYVVSIFSFCCSSFLAAGVWCNPAMSTCWWLGLPETNNWKIMAPFCVKPSLCLYKTLSGLDLVFKKRRIPSLLC